MKTIEYRLAFVMTAMVILLAATRGTAQTVVWSDNFDDGHANERWSADAGVWQMGSPSAGMLTGGAHSPPNCATTGLTANYGAGANSRLIRIQSFTVPPASQFPRLRFWHTYNFSNTGWPNYAADYGVVEIKAGASSWQAVSPQYTGVSGAWTYASVDLAAFAGRAVQVAFHLVSAGASGPGWYVDDIALETGTPALNNPEGWERGIGDWYVETGTWQVGAPTSGPGKAHGGAYCAATILQGNYPAGADSRLISPPFQVAAASTSPSLRFWHWYNFGNTGWPNYTPDYGVVEIRVGTGAWKAVSPNYTGASGAWAEPFIDLTPYGGQAVQLAFHLVPGGASGPGWFVDDVQVTPYAIPIGPILPAIPSTNIEEQALWQYTPTVNGTTWTFGLSNAPSGMSVNSSSGTISWTPTWQQAYSTYSNIVYMLFQSGTLVGSTNFNVTVINSNPSPVATATPIVTDGYVTGAAITYGGFEYTNAPGVRFIGGGGTGAEAVAVVSNQMVVAVSIVNPGSGYTNAPVVVIAPPFIPQPALGIAAMSLLSFTNLAVGTNYQLQSLAGGTLLNVGAPFSAVGSVFTDLVSGAAGPASYQLAVTPVPQQASATAQVAGGFVVGATVTSGGSGYTTNPAVTILGNDAGSNATATATVSGGSVTAITITSPGIGYSSGATIIIALPPTTVLWPNVTQVMELDLGRPWPYGSLSPYDNYQIQFTPVANGPWSDLGSPFTPTSMTYTQYVNVAGNAGFFRARYLP